MTAVDEYLDRVGGAMAGMDPAVRKDVLDELRSHLADSAAANGGDAARAIDAMGSAERVGREYRSLYGYSAGYKAVFAAVAAAFGVLTLPVLQGTTAPSGIPDYTTNLIALPFLVVLVGWLLWVSVAAGSRAGLLAGVVAFGARVAAALVLILVPSGGIATLDGLAVLVLSSALLVLVGWLPGTAKKTWSRPRAEL